MGADRESAAGWNGAVGDVFAYSQASPRARHVLLAIAHHVRPRSNAFPSIERIMAITGLGRSTVKRAIKELQDLGELLVEPGGSPNGGRRRSSRYVITLAERQPRLFDDGEQSAPAVHNRVHTEPGCQGPTGPAVDADRVQTGPRPGPLRRPTGSTVDPESNESGRKSSGRAAGAVPADGWSRTERAARGLVARATHEVPKVLELLEGKYSIARTDIARAIEALATERAAFEWSSELAQGIRQWVAEDQLDLRAALAERTT